MLRISLTFLIGLSLAACTATTGKQVSAQDARQFVPGTSTVSDVEAKLGAPSHDKTNSDGTTTLEYDYTHLRTNAMTYVPIANMFAGKTDVNQSSTTFLFSSDGILKSYSSDVGGSTESMTGTK